MCVVVLHEVLQDNTKFHLINKKNSFISLNIFSTKLNEQKAGFVH